MTRNKDSILGAQIRTAAAIWEDIQNSSLPADRWLGNYFHHNRKKCGSRDRRFLSETTYALFRHKLFIREWCRHLLAKDADATCEVLLAAKLERLIPSETFYSLADQFIPRRNLTSDLAEKLENFSLPPGTKTTNPEEEISLRHSFPLWLVNRWSKQFGLKECRDLIAVMQQRPPLTIRINPVKMTRERQIERFKELGWGVIPTVRSSYGLTFRERVNVFDTEDFRKGFFDIQDEGSQIICQMVDPQPGEILWDVCAGGGGKSLLLAAMMQNKGRVIATDLRMHKLDSLRMRYRKAGIMNIFPAELDRISEIKEVQKKGIDRILIDAPCSGSGTLRRNPDAKWKLTEGSFAEHQKNQLAIAEKAIPFLKKGGRFYYVTCSLDPLENEEVMKEIFSRHPGLRQVIYPKSRDGYFRLFPHKEGTDGFFLGMAENKGVE